MKTLKTERAIKDANRLLSVIEQRKALEREEKLLKDLFKAQLEDARSLKAGNVIITLIAKQRQIISKDLVLTEFGADGLKKVQTISQYDEMSIVLDQPLEQRT